MSILQRTLAQLVRPHILNHTWRKRRTLTDDQPRYVADWTYALPTVAFFMAGIGLFVVSYALTQLLALSGRPGLPSWRKCVAVTRYLSYRGFRVEALGWNSAPIGVLLLGATGTIYFFCTWMIDSHDRKKAMTDCI